MSDVFPIKVTNEDRGVTYSAQFQTDAAYARQWKSVLKAAYGSATLVCQCNGKGAKRLAVKHYDEGDSFSVAKFPLSGDQHAQPCRFYAPGLALSGQAGYAKGVLDQRFDGTINIRLAIGLGKKDAVPDADEEKAPARDRSGKGNTQNKMKLLGLLHFLWGEADLNQWKPAWDKKRTLSRIHWWINEAADQLTVGKRSLSDSLVVATQFADSGDAKRNSSRVAGAIDHNRRLVVIAPLAQYTEERAVASHSKLQIAGFHGIPPIFLTEAIWKATERRYPAAVKAWRDGHRVIAIVQVEAKASKTPGRGPTANAIDLALMTVTANWVPVESGYERTVADMLTAQGRAFIKPLRFDSTVDLVLPDFILTDTEAPIPMEVFGRSDEPYEARKAEKAAYYAREFGVNGWWCWNAAADQLGRAIPAFPRAKASRP